MRSKFVLPLGIAIIALAMLPLSAQAANLSASEGVQLTSETAQADPAIVERRSKRKRRRRHI